MLVFQNYEKEILVVHDHEQTSCSMLFSSFFLYVFDFSLAY